MKPSPQQFARIAIIGCFLLLMTVSAVRAQSEFRIVDVVVEGNRVATRSLILGVSSLDVGTPFTPSAIAETIRRLYGLGIFSDVKIDVDETTGGLIVYIVVKELPKLTGLEFSGNKKIKTRKLREILGLGVGGYISPHLIEKKKNEIYQAYTEKGYFQAEISPLLEYSTDSTEAVLSYTIDEKSKVKVENVVIAGNQRVSTDKLIGEIRNRKRGFLRSSDFAQDKYDEDLLKVVEAYHKRGFVDAYIISDSISIDNSRNRMTIWFDVYEGPQYFFGTATFANNEEISSEFLERLLKYEEGDVFNLDKYDESLFELASAYYEIGHLHIRINDLRTTVNDSIIDINYDITEGLPSYINLVNIVGNNKTKEKVIRREVSVLPGQKFNRSLLIRSVRDVMALNFFTNVEPVPVDLPNGDVDIEFKVEEKQTGQVSAGAGYNSQDKIVGTLGMGIPNFNGNGQNLSFNVDFGSRRNSFSVSFTEPWLFGHPTLMGVNAFALNRRWFDDYTEGRTGFSLRFGRRLRWPDNYSRVYASYSLERNRFFDFDDGFVASNSYKSTYFYDDPSNNPPDQYIEGFTANRTDSIMDQISYGPYPGSIIEYEEEGLTASRLTATIIRDSRNLPEFATRGSMISYRIETTGDILGGFWKYQKHEISLAKFIPLFGQVAIAAKFQYGVVTSPSGDNRVLITDRFTPGGTAYDGIVRGYEDGSLTPDSMVTQSDTSFFYNDPNAMVGVDPPDDTTYANFRTRVRGKYMLVTNIELQIPISQQQLYALLFFDAGNSWLHRSNIKPLTDLYRSVGAGFRIVVPAIGTIGFDFGYALDDVAGQEKGWKPHFQIGTTFR